MEGVLDLMFEKQIAIYSSFWLFVKLFLTLWLFISLNDKIARFVNN